MTARKWLVISLVLLTAIYWLGVLGYILIDRNLSLLNAIYMVTITLSTVGYREVVTPTPANQAWTILLILVGSLTVMVLITSLAVLLVGGEVDRLYGGRKMETRIKQLEKHTIVCGFGRMGQLLVERLARAGVPLVVLERDQERLRELQALSHLFINGDATEEWILDRAGIACAKSLVAALAGDADNLFVALTARQMRPDLYIVARAENPSTEAKLRRAGANRVISPQTIGAEWIANVLTRPHVADFVDMAARGAELEMAEIEVSADSLLAGRSLRESDIRRRSDVMVVAIRRADGTTRFNPAAEELIRPGDLLITIGQTGAASKLSDLRVLTESKLE
jgi:voltage-gated potassium channel